MSAIVVVFIIYQRKLAILHIGKEIFLLYDPVLFKVCFFNETFKLDWLFQNGHDATWFLVFLAIGLVSGEQNVNNMFFLAYAKSFKFSTGMHDISIDQLSGGHFVQSR